MTLTTCTDQPPANRLRHKPMTHLNDDTDERLTALEIKASYTEDLLDRLDQIIIRQQAQIDRLQRDIQRLQQAAGEQHAPGPRNLRDELPPHY